MNKNLLTLDKTVNMPRYSVSKKDLIETEKEFCNRFPENNLINSKTVYNRKHSRIAGILGEMVFKNIYPEAQKSNDITYDFDWDGKRIDVKCKYRTVIPSLEYEASFFPHNINLSSIN